jgi:filamentous hemagglutinin family protein
MNCIYQLIRNDKTGAFVPVSEKTKSAGRRSSSCTTAMGCTLKTLVISLMMAFGTNAYALPVGGVVTAGGASISSGAAGTIITQSTQNAAINWQSFNIGQSEAVRFVQPDSSSVALNRVLGSDPSSILGSLSANGKVFLLNPNGILFGKGASVNVGGLVASTLNITDTDFMAGSYRFAGAGNGTILNQGSINADGGYVALLGANVSNEGIISAKLGTVALAAGNAITLDVAGDGLLNVTVNRGAVNALVQNGGLIQADGGQVLLTAQAAGSLLQNAVNNTGVIQARTIENHNGTIKLLGDMQSGTVNVGGTLDASAPNGGNGGFIETSAAHVKLADNAIVTTQSAQGSTGTWLIDPHDYKIDSVANGGDQTGAALGAALEKNNITILSSDGDSGKNGDINVNEAVNWTKPTTLTLNAVRDVNVNAAITATGGNVVLRADNDGKGEGTVKFAGNGKVSAILTTIRFNPADYTTTAAEIAAYLPKVTGALDAKAWVFAKGDDKVYDGTRDAEVYTTLRPDHLGNLPPGESLTTVGAHFDTKNVGHDRLITFSSYTLTGPADYALYVPNGTPAGSGTARADITPRDTNISGTRVYDATPTAAGENLTTISALLAGDSVAVAGSGTVADKNAAQNKDITNMGTLALAGTDAGNYNLLASGNKLTVTPAPLTVTADNATKIYGQTPILSDFTSAGLLNGETIGSVTETSPGTAANASVANSPYPITPSNAIGGTFTPSNYSITYVPGVLTVTPQVQPNPNITPVVTPQDQSIPNITPVVTPQPQPNPVVTPAVTPQVQPSPVITPAVTPQVQPSPVTTPAVTPQVQKNPVTTSAVTPQVQPNPVISPTVTAQIQPDTRITPIVEEPVQPDTSITPTVAPQVQPDPVIVLAETPQVQPDPVIVSDKKPEVQPEQEAISTEPTPKRYVPPQRPRKHDRN